MQRNVVILDIDYVTYEEKPVIRLFSKDGDKNIVLIDDTFEPYLYVMADDLDECIAEIEDNLDVVNIEKVQKKDFQIEKEFLKVTFKHPQELAKNRDNLRDLESVIQIREFDIPFYRRYLMDRDVIPMTEVVATGEKLDSFLDLDSEKQDVEIIKLTEELRSKGITCEFDLTNKKFVKQLEKASKVAKYAVILGEDDSVAGLIAHGPRNDAGPVLVALHAALYPVQHHMRKRRIIGKPVAFRNGRIPGSLPLAMALIPSFCKVQDTCIKFCLAALWMSYPSLVCNL